VGWGGGDRATHPEALLGVLLNLQARVLVAAEDDSVVVVNLRATAQAAAPRPQLHVLPPFRARLGLEDEGGIVVTCRQHPGT